MPHYSNLYFVINFYNTNKILEVYITEYSPLNYMDSFSLVGKTTSEKRAFRLTSLLVFTITIK